MIATEVSIVSYLTRTSLALVLLCILAFAAVRLGKKRGWAVRGSEHVKIMASLPLGRDAFFVLRCGPDVIALTSGSTGVRLVGRWKYEEWTRLEEHNGSAEPHEND